MQTFEESSRYTSQQYKQLKATTSSTTTPSTSESTDVPVDAPSTSESTDGQVDALSTSESTDGVDSVVDGASTGPSVDSLVDGASTGTSASTTTDGPIDAIVSFDGTWARRGHTSHYGVQSVILKGTGCVLALNVHSNYCQTCVQADNKNIHSEAYKVWLTTHVPRCRKNFTGSSPALEAAGAVELWKRSVAKFNLRLVWLFDIPIIHYLLLIC